MRASYAPQPIGWIVLLALVVGCGGGTTSVRDDLAAPGWRSVLYPADWSPAHTDADGRFLHDVSYAGYLAGAAPLPDGAGLPVVNALTHHGADPTGVTDATVAVQSALDAGALLGRAIVFLPAGTYRIDGLLTMQSSGCILRGAGAGETRLHFTRHNAMTGRSHLTIGTAPTLGAHIALAQDAQPRDDHVFVSDAQGLQVGDDVALGFEITDAFVDEHGMSGVWGPFNGSWQPFERREITQIDRTATPHRVTLDVPVRYPAKLRDFASLRLESGYIAEVGVEHLSIATAVGWDEAWANERTHAISFTAAKDSWVRGVHSFASPSAPATGPGAGAHLQNCGVLALRCKRVTIADCHLGYAQHRGGGGCGYLFELRQCNEVLLRDCVAIAGRHNFIQNWGFGTSGCVWLRCVSSEGLALFSQAFPSLGQLGYSEFHHSLATGNLIDQCTTDDGWSGVNRGDFSSGAGHSATQNVFWNTRGSGIVRSRQFGRGYVIGTAEGLTVQVGVAGDTSPDDTVEGAGHATTLRPPSLYLDQFVRRTGRQAEASQ